MRVCCDMWKLWESQNGRQVRGQRKPTAPSGDEGKSLEVRRNRQGCFSNVNVAERWQTVNEMSPCRLRDNA